MGSRFLCWIGLLLATIAGQAQAGFLNGSFENGLTGWQTAVTGAGTVSVVTSYSSYNPVQGAFFAQITGGTADVYQTLSQTFTASAGETLKGSAFFMTLDYLPFNDDGYVRLTLGNEVLFQSSVGALGNTSGNSSGTAWTPFSYLFVSSGTYTLEAGVINRLDLLADSVLGIDNVQLQSAQTVPEPATLSLLGMGLAGLAFARRRFSNTNRSDKLI
ncbi:MAG: PEP-CTERM sorting domain-containing protein [Pirellula sp.]